MDFNELKHFIAVVEHQGFSRAAANIFISQPTLSKSVKKLEEQLGVVLFERSTRKLELTDAGEIAYKQSLKIIDSTKELQSSLEDFLKVPTGNITFGIPPLIGATFFPKIAKGFNELNPKITLELIEPGAKKVERLIEKRQIDVGIVVLPVDETKFSVTPFIEEKFQLLVPTNHRLAEREEIMFSSLREEDFILFTPEFSLHHLIIELCENRGGFYPKIAYKTSQWDVITGLVAEGLGISILPKSASDKVDKSLIKTIEIHSPPMWKLGIITKKDRYLSLAVRSLLHFLQDDHYKSQLRLNQ